MNKKLEVKYFSKGGNFPYQAEGKISNIYFYFRSRHDRVSLELFRNGENFNTLSHADLIVNVKENSFLDDKQADVLIKKLYNIVKNSQWIKL